MNERKIKRIKEEIKKKNKEITKQENILEIPERIKKKKQHSRINFPSF